MKKARIAYSCNLVPFVLSGIVILFLDGAGIVVRGGSKASKG